MDKKDLKILKNLHKNIRPSYSKISKELGITENAVKYRINKLTKSGVVKGYFADIASHALGINIRVIFMLNVKSHDYNNSINKLKSYPEIAKIYRCSGTYSLICTGFFSDNEELVRFLDRKLLKELPVSTWIEHIVLKPYKETFFGGNMINI